MDTNHGVVSPQADSAESFCALGALEKCYRPLSYKHTKALKDFAVATNSVVLGLIAATVPETMRAPKAQLNRSALLIGIARWNDEPIRTKKQVLAAFRRAGL
jgi:hypothetical protein